MFRRCFVVARSHSLVCVGVGLSVRLAMPLDGDLALAGHGEAAALVRLGRRHSCLSHSQPQCDISAACAGLVDIN